jgi:hypothetical protein
MKIRDKKIERLLRFQDLFKLIVVVTAAAASPVSAISFEPLQLRQQPQRGLVVHHPKHGPA